MKIILVLNDTLKNSGKSQYWLAKQTGIAESTINTLCKGKNERINFNTIERICEALDCDITDIIRLER